MSRISGRTVVLCSALLALARPVGGQMRLMVEPAVEHVAGREGDRSDAIAAAALPARKHGVAIVAGAAFGKDRAHRLVGASIIARSRAGILAGEADLVDVAGPAARRAEVRRRPAIATAARRPAFRSNPPVPCATTITWTKACRRNCCASRFAAGAGRRR